MLAIMKLFTGTSMAGWKSYNSWTITTAHRETGLGYKKQEKLNKYRNSTYQVEHVASGVGVEPVANRCFIFMGT